MKIKTQSMQRTKNQIKLGWTTLLISLIMAAGSAYAETPEEKGLAIVIEEDRRDTGFENYTAELSMILRNRHGETSSRKMRGRFMETKSDGDKSLTIFDHPRDVKGTAFLSFTHKVGTDDQWLYLPALKRVKRIASNNKSGPFMGSEFAYEDISSQEVEKYTYKYLRNENLDQTGTFVVQRIPVDKKSGYTKQIVWINQEEYRPEKIDFYDRKDTLLKTLIFKEYRKYKNQFWRAHRMEMVNHQTGKSTDLLWDKFAFKTGLTDRDFNKSSLKRVR